MIAVDCIREHVPLLSVLPKSAADGDCPFCGACSFHLSAERVLYHCPDCGEQGDVINATMRVHGLDFRSAVLSISSTVSSSTTRLERLNHSTTKGMRNG